MYKKENNELVTELKRLVYKVLKNTIETNLPKWLEIKDDRYIHSANTHIRKCIELIESVKKTIKKIEKELNKGNINPYETLKYYKKLNKKYQQIKSEINTQSQNKNQIKAT